MQVVEKIRLTDEQIEALERSEQITIAASWEEFEEFLIEADYHVEYHNGQIVVVGLATFIL